MDKIIKKEKCLIRTSIVFLFVLSFSPVFALSGEISVVDKNSSMYRYSTLENTVSYFEMIKNNENLNPKQFTDEEVLIDDSIEKLEDLIKRHNFSTKRINESINSINEKSKLKTFVIGNNLGILKFQLVQINYNINSFNDLYLKTEDYENKIKIEQELNLLKEENLKVEKFILNQDNKFSLLGWFVVML